MTKRKCFRCGEYFQPQKPYHRYCADCFPTSIKRPPHKRYSLDIAQFPELAAVIIAIILIVYLVSLI